MQKLFTLSIFIFSSIQMISQSLPPAAQAVADAENNFARTSKEISTKAAFLAHLDPSCLVFNQGNPVNGLEQWRNQNENNSLLFWWPVYVDVASSGDFGYSTGPFEISQERNNPQPIGFGYYSSVWKKNEKGEWKVVIDMGAGFQKREDVYPTLKTTARPLVKREKVNYLNEKDALLTTDRQYINKINESGTSFHMENLSTEARIHRSGSWPYASIEAIKAMNETNKKFKFEQLGGDVASSGDLGYAFGKVNVSVMRDGNTRELNLNYLRVWKKEDDKWKIVLDVIGG